MKEERTNSFQIIDYFLIENNNKTPRNDGSSRKSQNDFNSLIENSQQEFNVENTIKQYNENKENNNKEMNERSLIQEENHKKFILQMTTSNDNNKKKEEEMKKDFDRILNELEERKNIELEQMRIEIQKEAEIFVKQKLDEIIEMEENFNNEILKKQKEINEMEIGFKKEKLNLKKKYMKEISKLLMDLTQETEKCHRMRVNLYKVERENELLVLENNNLKIINERNNEFFRILENLNNNRNHNTRNSLT